MNKFKLIIAAVAVGFMPAIAFCYESKSPLEKLIPGYQAAKFEEHRMNVNPYASVSSIPRVESVATSGENDEEADSGSVTCLKMQRQIAAQAVKAFQQAGTAEPAR